MGISRFANSAPNRERGSAVAGKKAADDDSDAAKKFAFFGRVEPRRSGEHFVERLAPHASSARHERGVRLLLFRRSARVLPGGLRQALLVVRRVGASVSLGKKASGALFRRSALG